MTKRELHAQLIRQGTTFRRWSLDHGYKPRTVHMVVSRWVGETGQPRGRLSFRILRDLSRDVGREVVPGILSDAA